MKTITYPKLPPAFKQKWIEALRSGKYRQATGTLYQDDNNQTGYCCLGVACRVAEISNDKLRNNDTIPEYFKRVPKVIRGNQDEPLIDKLVSFNDTKRWSFRKIATWIEKNL
jgi:hypothetical protein